MRPHHYGLIAIAIIAGYILATVWPIGPVNGVINGVKSAVGG